MRNTLLIILSLLALLITNRHAMAQAPFQSRPTAITIPRNSFEISALSPSRYGCGKKTEIFSTVFLDWKLPNLGLKHTWIHKPVRDGETGFFKERDIYFATVHNLDYPTMFFDWVQKYTPDYYCIVPDVITMRNEARVSMMLKKKTLCEPANFFLTLRAGVKNSFRVSKDRDSLMQPVTRPLWYRETVVCRDTIVWFAGLDLDIHITEKLNLLVDADFYSVDWNVKDWSGENKIFVYGYFGPKGNVMIQAGIKLLYGTVYGDFKFNALPMLDVSYFFSIKKKRDVGLFG